MNEQDNNSEDQVAVNEHATLSDLIMIRDGGENDKDAHVRDCQFCQARLEDVCAAAQSLQNTLLFSAELPVPASAWQRIESKLRERGITEQYDALDPVGQQDNRRDADPNSSLDYALSPKTAASKAPFWASVNTAIYSLALAIVFTGGVSLYTFNGQQEARVEARELQASIQNLMDNSRGLESVLQQVADQRNGNVMSVADRSAIDRLQWRLMLVDQQIHESESSDDVTYDQIKALWGERIEALTELNELYYANHVTAREGTF